MSKKDITTSKGNAVAEYTEPSPRKWYSKNFDRPFLMIVLALLSIGTIMVFSASYYFAEIRYGDPYRFARNQIKYVVLGVLLMFGVAYCNPYNWIKKLAVPAFIVILGFNYVVPMVGRAMNGSIRWFEIGSFTIQPSEMLKYVVILYFAYLLSGEARNGGQLLGFRLSSTPMLLMALLLCFGATILQGHLSATMILFALGVSMLFLGGIKFKKMVIAMVIFLIIVSILLLLFGSVIAGRLGHVSLRLKVWQDPFKYMHDEETHDAGWQPAQSLYAIASGGMWGVGLSKSNEKHGYLPEPQNDYIYSILCEEMGFFMAVVVICLFLALLWRGYIIAKRATNDFCRMIVMGTVIQIVLQAALNIAVVTNTIPSTGISLPFFSYGGTSLLMIMGECGILLSFSKYTYEETGD